MIADIELRAALPVVTDPSARHAAALLIARDRGRPVGRVAVELQPGEVLRPDTYEQPLLAACRRALEDADAGFPPVPTTWPAASVVVCTRGRADGLLATLDSIERLHYAGPLEIVVVDNAPCDDVLARTLAGRRRLPDRPVVRVVEPRPGLSHARNRGLAAVRGAVVAFTDDDAVVERGWLRALVASLESAPDVMCVTGLTLPAELETPAQEWYEQFGGHSKGRGFVREKLRAQTLGSQHPLYPFPPFGAGVNMAFDVAALREIGGFDPALGAGTPTFAAEDTAAFATILLRGWTLIYEPSAVARHTHRREEDALRRQMHGYGVGLTAYFAWCVHRHPREALGLARMVAPALAYLTGRSREHAAATAATYPRELTRAQRLGMVRGPWAYVRSLRAVRSPRAYPG